MLFRAGAARGTLLEDQELWRRQVVSCQEGGNHWEVIKKRVDALLLGKEVQTMIEEYAHMPHPKRKLRIRAYNELRDTGVIHTYCRYTDDITAKMKIPEYAKPGKPGRIIGDYACPASLLAGYMYEQMKEALSSEFMVGNIVCQFVKTPRLSTLDSVFEQLINSRKNVLVFFSDDACFAVTIDGVRRMFNLDISKCDASHGSCIFDIIPTMVSELAWKDLATASVEQCTRWNTVYSPKDPNYGKRKKKLFMYRKCGQPMLSSGWSGTTLINCVAVIKIAEQIAKLPFDNPETLERDIKLAANSAGYVVTAEFCHSYHSLQFLKHSPVRDASGRLRAILNLGVVLRTLGQCDGDLPGRGDIDRRALEFNSSVIRGMCYMGNHCIHTALRKRFNLHVAPRASFLSSNIVIDRADVEVDDSEVCVRYGIALSDLHELVRYIEYSEIGDRIHCNASARILAVDYGL